MSAEEPSMDTITQTPANVREVTDISVSAPGVENPDTAAPPELP